jgi:pimeloyl-ACP methyl ester carboxylesterase
MRKNTLFFVCLCCVFLLTTQLAKGQSTSKPFEFQFENKTLKGFIEMPQNKNPKAAILLIPGYGRTRFAEGRTYVRLRKKLLEYGLTVITWDKMGCGNSEGIFDANQPVESSAREAFEAIKTIQKIKVKGSETIGLWGLSRAGWICPLINELYPVDFWISVSGTNDKENFGYLLKSNLIIAGKGPKEADRLYQSWMNWHRIVATGGTYEESIAAMQPLYDDDLSRKLFRFKKADSITEEGRLKYQRQQKSYTSKGRFDPKSGLWVYIENFDQILAKVKAPVLAIFGEKDSQVDWRATKALYERVYEKNQNLTVKTFPNGNHILQKAKTGGWREDLSASKWAFCDGYFEVMETWLRDQNLIE